MLYSGSVISGAFSGLIAAGIVNGMAGVRGLGAWRWLFIIEGAITVSEQSGYSSELANIWKVAIAFAANMIMPNFPRTTKWLKEDEKAMAVWRLEEDIGSDDWVSSGEQSLYYGAWLAVK